jgi:hypothetical protein
LKNDQLTTQHRTHHLRTSPKRDHPNTTSGDAGKDHARFGEFFDLHCLDYMKSRTDVSRQASNPESTIAGRLLNYADSVSLR